MQRERIELFRNHAQFVGPSCMIPDPGDYFAFDDTGVPILIVRNAEGELNAFVNICSHRGAPSTSVITARRALPVSTGMHWACSHCRYRKNTALSW